MLNYIWLSMIILSVVCGIYTNHLTDVVNAVTSGANLAFTTALSLAGIMIFWLGLMNIAEQAGLTKKLAELLMPILRRLFPEIPNDHPAMQYILLNFSANMLGLNNAATPFGLKAMQALQTLNENKTSATNAMCLFLAINTSSIQLIPTTAIALLAAGGSSYPTEIVITTLLATIISTTVGILSAKYLQNSRIFQ